MGVQVVDLSATSMTLPGNQVASATLIHTPAHPCDLVPSACGSVVGPDPSAWFQLSQAYWHFQSGTCVYSQGAVDWPVNTSVNGTGGTTGGAGIGGCFTQSDAVELSTSHSSGSTTWLDSVNFTPAAFSTTGQSEVSILDRTPNLVSIPNNVFKSWYVRYNEGQAVDQEYPAVGPQGQNLPKVLTNQPPVYPTTAPAGATSWPPNHFSAWHLIEPGATANSFWKIENLAPPNPLDPSYSTSAQVPLPPSRSPARAVPSRPTRCCPFRSRAPRPSTSIRTATRKKTTATTSIPTSTQAPSTFPTTGSTRTAPTTPTRMPMATGSPRVSTAA